LNALVLNAKRTPRSIIIAGALLTVAFALLRNFCPASGFALSSSRSEIHRLKNRIAIPQTSDFDERVTLEKLLEPGADQARWSESRAARLEGYVVSIAPGPFEAANCYCARDIHIMIASRVDPRPNERVVLEVTPRMRLNQNQAALNSELVGHRVRFEGWLFFDSQHSGEAENTMPGRPENWRATAWELHPLTKIEILK
jgi:hypothetical protein